MWTSSIISNANLKVSEGIGCSESATTFLSCPMSTRWEAVPWPVFLVTFSVSSHPPDSCVCGAAEFLVCGFSVVSALGKQRKVEWPGSRVGVGQRKEECGFAPTAPEVCTPEEGLRSGWDPDRWVPSERARAPFLFTPCSDSVTFADGNLKRPQLTNNITRKEGSLGTVWGKAQ